MICIKTGCSARSEEYDSVVYGDAYQLGELLILRITEVTYDARVDEEPDFFIRKIECWFDRNNGKKTISTLISSDWVAS